MEEKLGAFYKQHYKFMCHIKNAAGFDEVIEKINKLPNHAAKHYVNLLINANNLGKVFKYDNSNITAVFAIKDKEIRMLVFKAALSNENYDKIFGQGEEVASAFLFSLNLRVKQGLEELGSAATYRSLLAEKRLLDCDIGSSKKIRF